jgi:cytidylate kinase
MIVAIDGPAGAGKSTVARAVADRLGWRYLDTGGLYRAAALAVLEGGLGTADRSTIEDFVGGLEIATDGGRVTIDGRDVGDRIRDEKVTEAVPAISALPGVRAALAEVQRSAARGDIVMEGRDLGTVVVPDADLKVFLTASLDERARRRASQLGEVATGPRLHAIKRSIGARDETDSTRGQSPLKRAQDAVLVDSTGMSEDEVVDRIIELVRARRGG